MAQITKPIITDETGLAIVTAISQSDIAQARIAEINAAAELKKDEVLASIPSDYTELSNKVNNLDEEVKEILTTPDSFDVSGDDSDKLEYAINHIEKGGTLFIDRDYTLTRNIIITRVSSVEPIYIVGLREHSIIDTADYIFTSNSGNIGNIFFKNLSFKGKNVFDGNRLIRLFFDSCSFRGLDAIGYVDGNSKYFQTIHITNCVIRNIKNGLLYAASGDRTKAYDILISGCLIEWCNGCIINCKEISVVNILNNCIEGFAESSGLFPGMKVIWCLNVKDNYFEGNETVYFDFSDHTGYNTLQYCIEGNSILEFTNDFVFVKFGTHSRGASDSFAKISNNYFYNSDSSNAGIIFDGTALNNSCKSNIEISGNVNFNNNMILAVDPYDYLLITQYGGTRYFDIQNALKYHFVSQEAGEEKGTTTNATGIYVDSSTMDFVVPLMVSTQNTNYIITITSLGIRGISGDKKDLATIIDKRNNAFVIRVKDTTANPFTSAAWATISYTIQFA